MKTPSKFWSLMLLALLCGSIVQAQTISVDLVSSASFCADGTGTVDYSVSAPFGSNTVFTVELSDNAGSFAAPVAIGSSGSTTTGGTINITIPSAVTTSAGYKIRVTEPGAPTVSGNTLSLTLNARPTISFSVSPGATSCLSTNVTYTTAPAMTSYIWSVPGVLNTDYSITSGSLAATSNTVTLQWLTTGSKNVTINYTDANGCTGAANGTSTTTVGNNVATPVFGLGATSTICQGSAPVTYTATAADATGITYSLITAPASAGTTINTSTGQVTYDAGFSGTATITASAAGCGGPKTTNHTVTVTPTVSTPIFSSGATSTTCQASAPTTYTASASNTTGITYSLLTAPASAGTTINSTTGQVTYDPGFSGTATITASAAGCNGPKVANHTVTVTPTVGTPIFGLGATSTICQASAPITYTATASNSTAVTYTLNTSPVSAGTTINGTTGQVTYAAGFSGTATITAHAAGCNGPKTANHTVTVTPTVGTPIFSLGATSTTCQASAPITYSASASNTTGITYSLLTAPASAGTTINASTGQVTYDPGFSGTATITASAAGCNGPKTANHTVTVTPTVGTPVFVLGTTSTICQGSAPVTYTANATDATGITYSLDAASLAGGCSINSGTGKVTYAANWNGTSVITAHAAGCNGPKTATHTVSIIGKPVFALGDSSTRCQGYVISGYTATSANSTNITYSFVSGFGSSALNATAGFVAWDPAVFGTAVFRATENTCALSSDHVITIDQAVGPVSFGAASPTACQGSTVTYTATATAATSGIAYSIATTPAGNATINATTGQVSYAPGFTGSAIITATASGCGTPTVGTHSVVITPVVTTPVFNAGPASTICQNPGAITYTATASNLVSPMVYSVSPAGAGVMNASTGLMTYSNTFSGTATINALATGCAGTKNSNFVVSVTPSVGVPVFGVGSSSVRKQGAGTQTYGATVTNGTMSYSLTPSTAGSIISTTGNVTFNSSFSGTATITAVASGCNTTGASTITHSVTVVQTPIFVLGATSVRCQGAGSTTYTANSSNGTVSYSLSTNPASPGTTINAGTGAVTYASDFFGTATISAVGTNGVVVTDTAKHTVTINKAPRLTAPTPTNKTICSGDTLSINLVATTGVGSSFAWTLAGGANTTGQATGNVAVINQVLTNSSNASADSLYYILTVTSPAPASCVSVILDSIKVKVNPKPVFTPVATATICSQGSTNINLNASAPSTFSWTTNAASKILGSAPGSGSLISQTLVNTDSTATPTSGTVAYRISTTSLNGCVGKLDSVVVIVNPLPRVTFGTGNSLVRCSGAQTGINITANIPSTFTYTTGTLTTLGLVSGNTGGSGNTINQTLSNSSNLLKDSIYYTVTPTTVSSTPTCIGVPKTVVVTVNPNPAMTSPTLDSVCSQSIAIIPVSATLPSTFSWTKGINTGGITGQNASTGSVAVTSINEALSNPSFTTAGNVQYIVTPTTVSLPNCVGLPQTINVKVNPLPKMLSDSTRTICSDSILDYVVVSSTGAGSTYTYSRSSNSLNIPFKAADTSFQITDHLVNFLSSQFVYTPKNVDYFINLKSKSGCSFNGQKLAVSVSPTPSEPGISIAPPSNLCLNVLGQNFGAGRPQNPAERYVWSGPSVLQRVDSTFYSLISFPTSGTQFVSVRSHVVGFACNSVTTTRAFTVGTSGASDNPNVVLFAENLICQAPNVDRYQWGFDSKASLDSTILTGATTQNLFVGAGSNFDPNNRYYWVIATFKDGCQRKAYFNSPNSLGVNPVKTFAGVEIKVYPNPVTDQYTLELPNTKVSQLNIEIFDLAGRRINSLTSNSAKTLITAKELLPGYYVIVCSQNGVRIATTRFIKN